MLRPPSGRRTLLDAPAPLPPPSSGERAGAPVSVVITALDPERVDDLVTAVASAVHQTVRPLEVIAVLGPDVQPAAPLPGCRRVPHSGEGGRAGARNHGAAVASGDLLAFLDADVVAAPDWLERLLAAFTDPRVVAAGGKVEASFDGRRPAWLPREYDWVIGCSPAGLPEDTGPIPAPLAANLVVRAPAFRAALGFSNTISGIGEEPLGGEEAELCLRLRLRHGLRAETTPAAAPDAGSNGPAGPAGGPTADPIGGPPPIVQYVPAARVWKRVRPHDAGFDRFRRRAVEDGRARTILGRLAAAADVPLDDTDDHPTAGPHDRRHGRPTTTGGLTQPRTRPAIAACLRGQRAGGWRQAAALAAGRLGVGWGALRGTLRPLRRLAIGVHADRGDLAVADDAEPAWGTRLRSRTAIVVALATQALLAALVALHITTTVRPFLALAVFGFVPGFAWLRRLRTRDPLTEVAVMFAAGFSATAVLGSSLAWLHLWSRTAGLGTILALTTPFLVVDLVRERHAGPPVPTPTNVTAAATAPDGDVPATNPAARAPR